MKDSVGKDRTRKGEILSASRRWFARHGFAKTTLDDIAGAVGMKKASLYYYYDSKDAIFRDVIAYESEEALRWLEDQVARKKTPESRILHYTRARLDYFRKVTNLLDVSIQVLVEVRPLVDELYQDFLRREIDLLASVIRDGVAAGQFRRCDSRRVASAILMISESFKFKAFHDANVVTASEVDYADVENEADYFVKLVLAGICKRKSTW